MVVGKISEKRFFGLKSANWNILISFFFLLDIIFNARTTYANNNGDEVCDTKKMLTHYVCHNP